MDFSPPAISTGKLGICRALVTNSPIDIVSRDEGFADADESLLPSLPLSAMDATLSSSISATPSIELGDRHASEDRTQRYRNTSDLPASSRFEARSSHFQDNLGPRWLRGCCCLAYKDVILQTRVVSDCKRKRSQEEKETDQYHRPSLASSTTAALEAGGGRLQ